MYFSSSLCMSLFLDVCSYVGMCVFLCSLGLVLYLVSSFVLSFFKYLVRSVFISCVVVSVFI